MAQDYGFTFTSEEMVVNDNLGYPKAYAKLCRDRGFSPYSHGPPFSFLPYALHDDEVERASFLDDMFPIIDPKAKPTTKPRIFVSILWNQLSHLGNAGFDPAVIRVDAYGNVLYYHADSASPLAWDFDHWFPCSRGGLTVLSNLRIVQRQVYRRKKNKLEFLVPWWDFQLGISVNQFLSIFASSKSDFRHRGFSFLFSEGENHELNDTQIVDSHSFPQHFIGFSEEVGLAPAAIVESRRDPYDALALRQLDHNKKTRPMSSAIVAARKPKGNENEDPNFVRNPYQAIVMARDSLKQKEEASKMQLEMQKLDNEVNEMKLKNDEEKLVIQDLELALIKRKRKAEKCRRLAEAQSSYRTMLEKMIRDTMHQSVIYKEQVRLNQAASNALTARLEAQRTICDNAEKEFHKKYKQKDDIEKQLRPEFEQGRKRFRMDDSAFEEERENNKTVFYLPRARPRTPFHKELRVLLDEEQRASEAGLSVNEEELKIAANNVESEQKVEEHIESSVALDEEKLIEQRLQKLEISEEKRTPGFSFRGFHEKKDEEDDETRNQRGKGNVEKWLQLLLENGQEEGTNPREETNESAFGKTEDIIQQLNQKFPQKELRTVKKELQVLQDKKKEAVEIEETNDGFDKTKIGKNWKDEQQKLEKRLVRSESAKVLRRIPSSPSLFQGMKSSIKSIKKAVKL
ncbi:uncharacterized protein LOC131654101 [Vicia villosa]|uniref:uncharacterized protein LOC131654101 n=1 Tax=Vicia villosa TaxID=3911 RepID=UPI00273B019A|nr:uncharacterized protein LOC131654101 [Vicia villosa]